MDQQLRNINTRLDKLTTFLHENMLTKQELENLRAELPTRGDFAQIQTAVDGIAKRFRVSDQEFQVAAARITRMETWIQKAAAKIGLEYKPSQRANPFRL